MSAKLAGRIALITGASRGIGAAVARRYAQEGAHLILVARNAKALETVDDEIRAVGGTATLVAMDLTDSEKVELLAQNVAARFGKLDILVGNAGILGELSPMPHGSPQDWDKVLATNLTANWQLIRCFDALLRVSEAGRALFVSSGVASRVAPYWSAYAVSKVGLESMVKIYAAENEKTPLKINLVDPGATATRMRAQAFPGEDVTTLPTPDSLTDIFVKLAEPALRETGQLFKARG